MLGDAVGFFGFFVFFGAGVLDLVGAGVLDLVGAGVLTLVGAEVLTLVGARVLTAIAKPRPPTPPPFIDWRLEEDVCSRECPRKEPFTAKGRRRRMIIKCFMLSQDEKWSKNVYKFLFLFSFWKWSEGKFPYSLAASHPSPLHWDRWSLNKIGIVKINMICQPWGKICDDWRRCWQFCLGPNFRYPPAHMQTSSLRRTSRAPS